MKLTIKRETVTIALVEVGEETIYQRELMGMHKISAEFTLSIPVDFFINDYIEYQSEKYYIKSQSEVQKINSVTYVYAVIFQGASFLLYDSLIQHLGRTSFSYTGTPAELLSLIVTNMKRLDASWQSGTVSSLADIKTFTFSDQSCRTALTQIAESFGLEYAVNGYTIDLKESIGLTQAATFQYGLQKGLYTLTRKAVDQSFATRWYGFGGTKNLAVDYRSALGRLSFDESPIDVNEDIYGVKEGVVTFEDVYPQRTSTVTATAASNSIEDSALDFDINDKMIEDSAKIVFKTGDLSGNEFVIQSYDHSTKKIVFGQIIEDTGYTLPNDTVRAAIGDKYTLTGIIMPESYITAAEADLKTKTEAHAAENSSPKVVYDLEIDEKYIRSQVLENTLTPGDRIHIVDIGLNIDGNLRIQSVEWPLVNESQVTAVISEEQLYTVQEQIAKDVAEAKRELDQDVLTSSYAKNLADLINNAAINTQFLKTFITDQAVLTGAFLVGNPSDGVVGGVNGAGAGGDSIVFFAGSSYSDRSIAPYRVRRDGNVYATALELLTGCKIGNFEISTDKIKSTNYEESSDDEGIIITQDGIGGKSSNLSLLIPGFTGYSIKGSLVGINYQNQSFGGTGGLFQTMIAGVIGWDKDRFDSNDLRNIQYCRGTYGGFFNSIKNIGAEYHDWIYESAGTDFNMAEQNSGLIIGGNISNVYLPERPDTGWTCYIKNDRSSNTVINRSGTVDVIRNSTSDLNSFTLGAGSTTLLRFRGGDRKFYRMF